MISFNQTFDEARAIKVLVVPIGDNSMYDKHFEIVSRTRNLPVFDLNRPSEWKNQNSMFKNFNWLSGGANILFEYLRYDRVANGPSDLDNFQCCRRILVVIGVINYPELDSSTSSRLIEDMDYYSRRHPHVVLKRYFVFNYFAAVASMSDGGTPRPPPQLPFADNNSPSSPARDPYAMVIFPPDGECEGGSMIDVHTKEIMGNVAVRLFQDAEERIATCEELRVKLANTSAFSTAPFPMPPWLPLTTTYEEMEDNSGGSEASRRVRRRLPGRIRKWMGDLCMQVCSPQDAWEHYSAAISDCRSQNDSMWLASSLEGSVLVMLTMLRLGSGASEELLGMVREIRSLVSSGGVGSVTGGVVRVAEERCVEAMSLYSRNIALCGLEVECSLRLARMHEQLSPSPERQQKVMEFVLRAAAVPGLNLPQQIECTIEGAFTCLRMNMKRKYAFLLYVAALLSADSENVSVAHSLVRCACQQYGIQLAEEEEQDIVTVNPERSWAGMRRMLLAHSAHFAKEFGDTSATARCLAALLRLVGEMEENRHRNRRLWIGSSSLLEDMKDSSGKGSAYQSPLDTDPKAQRWRENSAPQQYLQSTVHKFSFSGQSTMGSEGKSSPRGLEEGSVNTASPHAPEPDHPRSISVSAIASNMSYHDISRSGRSSSYVNNGQATLNSMTGMDHSQQDTVSQDDSHSEHSDHSNSNWGARFNPEALKNVRGHINVPKISPFVQNLVLKKKKKLGPRSNVGVGSSTSNSPFSLNGSAAAVALAKQNGSVSDPAALHCSLVTEPTSPSHAPLDVTPSTPPASTTRTVLHVPSSIPDPSYRLGVPLDSQSQSLSALSSVCAEIPPATPLVLDGLPFLIRLRPIPATEDQAYTPINIIPRDSVAASVAAAPMVAETASALFYDPFEAKRRKDKSRSSTISLLWSVGTVAIVEATLCNPLAVPMHLHDVHLLIDGPQHSCRPAKSVVIPPKTKEFSTHLAVCPRATGPVQIKGIRYSIYNAVHCSYVDSATGKGLTLSRELALPWKYPWSVVKSHSKTPPAHFDTDPEEATSCSTGNSDASANNNRTTEVSVVPESAALSLSASWGPDLGQQQSGVGDLENMGSEKYRAGNATIVADSVVTGCESLAMKLYDNEVRRETIRLNNLSASLKVVDLRITVVCTWRNAEIFGVSPSKAKAVYTLLPFTQVLVAGLKTDPSMLPASVFKRTHSSGDDAELAFPILVRLVGCDESEDVPRVNLPLAPRDRIALGLEFSNFMCCGSTGESAEFDLRIDVEYISEFPGMDRYLLQCVNDSEKPMEPSQPVGPGSDTVYVRRSILDVAVELSSDIRVSAIVPLDDALMDLNKYQTHTLSGFEIVSRCPFIPHRDSVVSANALAAVKEALGKSSEGRCREEGGTLKGTEVSCCSKIRRYAVEITNQSPCSISISTSSLLKGSETGSAQLKWQCVYPRGHSGDLEADAHYIEVAAHSSVNIIALVSVDDLRTYFQCATLTNDISQREAYRQAMSSLCLNWSMNHSSIGGGNVLSRKGRFHCTTTSDAVVDSLMLPTFEFNSYFSKSPASTGDTTIYVQARQFHRFRVDVKLLPNDPSSGLMIEEDKRRVEVLVVIVSNNDNRESTDFVVTGRPRAVLEAPVKDESGNSSFHHEISVCFTRCRGYFIYTFVRELDIADGEMGNSIWWTLDCPVCIVSE
mmetsp:Transcript_1167/g.1895  ORF Transcript_1167/g.1895 Transcript_1167/m.1895 type:complete len:1683 (+) Transcript_1167:109-5157(+)